MESFLLKYQDLNYKSFMEKLVPTVNPDKIIGVRTPNLRRIAKEMIKTGNSINFISKLPHNYFEEDNLHGFIISQITDYRTCIYELERFLPFVDNWATCDGIRPDCFKDNKQKLYDNIIKWISLDKSYTVRFGIEMLMLHYLDENFSREILKIVACIKSDEYYVLMMQSWFFATALAKQWEETIPLLVDGKLNTFVHNKTISKAIDSFRITNLQKEYLKKLRRPIKKS